MAISLLLSDTPIKLYSTMHATCFSKLHNLQALMYIILKKSSFKFHEQVKLLGPKQRGGFRSVVLIRISLRWKKSL